MGKLTVKQAEALVKEGLVKSETLEQMQSAGLVSTRRTSNKRYFKIGPNVYCSPQVYFQGIGKNKPTKKMLEFKTKVDALIEEYTFTLDNKTDK